MELNANADTARNTLSRLPDSITSPNAKLVYLYLVQQTRATLDEICTHLNLKKLTTYPILSTLVDKGYLTKNGDEYAYQPRAE